jgi:type II secretory pathway component PulK
VRKPKRSRSGAILIVAMVAVAIFTSLAATNIRSVLRHRQTVKSERDLIQAQLLCDAGCDRAASRFAADPNYRGEVWIERKDPSSGVEMKVSIEIQPNEGKTFANVQASVDGRSHQPTRVQRTKLIVLSQQP